jgi:hypothetical protein
MKKEWKRRTTDLLPFSWNGCELEIFIVGLFADIVRFSSRKVGYIIKELRKFYVNFSNSDAHRVFFQHMPL